MVENEKIFISAGEISGDVHGANLIKYFHENLPNLSFYGLGGKHMLNQGLHPIVNEDVSLTSSVGVLEAIPFLMNKARWIKCSIQFVLKNNIKTAIFVDNQEFSIAIAKALHKKGVCTLFYIAPHVSQGGKYNLKRIPTYFDRFYCFLKEDYELYKKVTDKARFYGVPLFDFYKENPKIAVKKNNEVTTISFFTGSRLQEVKTLLKPMMEAAKELSQKIENVFFLFPVSHRSFEKDILDMAEKYDLTNYVSTKEKSFEALKKSDVAVLSAGTATLEAGFLKVPHIIVYKISFITYLLVKIFMPKMQLALSNIVAGSCFFPELFQYQVTSKNIVQNVFKFLNMDEAMKKEMNQNFANIEKEVGVKSSSKIAVKDMLEFLKDV